ncbi:hypothetical protein [Novipirellula sp.]|uniref:hypothetical protein n=1 Tax=Novipirellula sp. TaxID=2795430 RepID=UPI003565484D
MSGERGSLPTVFTWMGGGLIVGIAALFGLRPGGSAALPDPPLLAVHSDASNAMYPSIEGTISLPGSMWEDPFTHAYGNTLQDLASKMPDHLTASDVTAILKDKLGDDGRIMYLVVPVPGAISSDSDGLESHVRKRHAVELALANQGFNLSFPNRMTYRPVTLNYHFSSRVAERRRRQQPPQTSTLGEQTDAIDEQTEQFTDAINAPAHLQSTSVKISTFLPTKLYKHRNTADYVLITWVQETHLGEQPLSTLYDILQPIMVDSQGKKNSAFALLGPTFSGALRDLVRDGEQLSSTNEHDQTIASFFDQWELGAVVCNTSCTATDSSLGLSGGQADLKIGAHNFVKLIHTIGSDERLLTALQRELSLRGVWPTDGSTSKLVIFAEQSSLSYVEEMQKSLFETSDQQPVVIPYLKNIAASGSVQSGGESRGGHSSVKDYLNRSMEELGKMASSRLINPSRVRAVGILGSSWEDKNLILEKARPIFPVATFFTTELDARYSLPDYNAHTRNLVVASHYGLGVRGRSNIFGRVNNIPSFRDGYQTSAFVGMSVLCHAFLEQKLKDNRFEKYYGDVSQDLFDLVGRRQTKASESVSHSYLQPLAFEIGTTTPIQLSATQSPEYLPLRQPAGVTSIHEHRSLIGAIVIAMLGIFLGFNFLAAFSTDASNFRDRLRNGYTATTNFFRNFVFNSGNAQKHDTVWPIAIPLFIGVLIFTMMVISDRSVQSEPILFTDGVSIWPTVLGLYLVIVMSVREINNRLPNLAADAKTTMQPPPRLLTWKLALTIAIVFYVISFLESGFIEPPARDWAVRWLATALLFAATLCVLLVACKSLLFSLYARKVIENFRDDLPTSTFTDSDGNEVQRKIVNRCRSTMKLSIDASRKLLWPAVLSIVFIVARSNWWDSWGHDNSWIALLVSPIIISFVAAIVVRFTAVGFRSEALEFLSHRRYELLSRSDADQYDDAAKLLAESIKEITRLDRGPFGPLSRDYLLGAAALVATILFTGPMGAMLTRVLTIVP